MANLPVGEGQVFQQIGANGTKTANYGVVKNGQVDNVELTNQMNQDLGVSSNGTWANSSLNDQQKQQAVSDWHAKTQQALGGNVVGLDSNTLSQYLVNPTTYGKAALGGQLNSISDLNSYASKPTTTTVTPDNVNSDWYKRQNGLLPAQSFANGKYIGSDPNAPENMTDQQRMLAGFSTKDGVNPYSGALAVGGTPTGNSAVSVASVPQNTGGRLLGPHEYAALSQENGVTPATFGKYFYKQGNDIYLRPDAPGPQSPTSPTVNLSKADASAVSAYPYGFQKWWSERTDQFRAGATTQSIQDEYTRWAQSNPQNLAEAKAGQASGQASMSFEDFVKSKGLNPQAISDAQKVALQQAYSQVRTASTTGGGVLGATLASTNIPTVNAPSTPIAPMPTGEFKVDVPTSIPSSTVNAALTSPTTGVDIAKLLADNQAMTQKYLDALKPSTEENNLGSQLSQVRSTISDVLAAQHAQFDQISAETKPMPFIVGEQQELANRNQRQLETLSNIEKNLVDNLGLAKDARVLQAGAIKDTLGWEMQTTQLVADIQDKQATREQNLLMQTRALSADARQSLGMILDQFKGLSYSDLPASAQQEVASLSAQAGIPPAVTMTGMQTVKDSMAAKAIQDRAAAQLDYQSKIDTRVQSIASEYRSAAPVQTFSLVAEGQNYASNFDVNTQNPADDVSLIYAFSKVNDPNSVVREGEFRAAQDSIQSLPESIQSQLQQALNGNGMLTPTARQRILQTIQDKYTSKLSQYNAITDQYAKQIDLVTGNNDGSDYLVNYNFLANSSGRPGATASSSGGGGWANSFLDSLSGGANNVASGGGGFLGAAKSAFQAADANLGASATVDRGLVSQLPKKLAVASIPTNLTSIANAIGQFESGGNYQAIGKVVQTGMYAGDRAYGKYQIMGKNIPFWTKEAIGKSMTIDQFLKDPSAQDKVAQFKMKQSLDSYGNVEDVASVWFTGKPLERGAGASDVNGTSGLQYATAVRSIYDSLSNPLRLT